MADDSDNQLLGRARRPGNTRPRRTPGEQEKVQALAKDPAILSQVQQDVDLAMAQQVRQTPTLLVSRGAKRYAFPGPALDNYPILKSLIDQLLK